MDPFDWPYQPGELKVLPVSGGYHRIVDGRGVNVLALFAADPRRAAAAPVLRSFVDPATGCTYTETAPGSGRYTLTACPTRR